MSGTHEFVPSEEYLVNAGYRKAQTTKIEKYIEALRSLRDCEQDLLESGVLSENDCSFPFVNGRIMRMKRRVEASS
jgi:hypothetical protein